MQTSQEMVSPSMERGTRDVVEADWSSVNQSCSFLAVQVASLCTSSTQKPVSTPLLGLMFTNMNQSVIIWTGFEVEKVHSDGIFDSQK